MKLRTLFPLFFLIASVCANSQTVKFFQPTVENMSYLMAHVDTNLWNQKLNSVGLRFSKEKVENQVEYKKQADDIYQYVGYDVVYGVLTVVWKDASGKKSIIGDLKKELKGKETNTPSTYKLNYGGVDY